MNQEVPHSVAAVQCKVQGVGEPRFSVHRRFEPPNLVAYSFSKNPVLLGIFTHYTDIIHLI